MDRPRGKVAIVSGAGSDGPGWGSGKAIAVLFAREGARVLAADCNAAAVEVTRALIESEGGECIAHTADVTREPDVPALADRGPGCVWAH